MTRKTLLTTAVATALVFTGLLATTVTAGAQEAEPTPTTPMEAQYCLDTETGAELSYQEAVEVAQSSECIEQGKLKETHFCNQYTGTWWIDLDVDKPGCSPACVVNLSEKTAEINWRCTGLLPPAPPRQEEGIPTEDLPPVAVPEATEDEEEPVIAPPPVEEPERPVREDEKPVIDHDASAGERDIVREEPAPAPDGEEAQENVIAPAPIAPNPEGTIGIDTSDGGTSPWTWAGVGLGIAAGLVLLGFGAKFVLQRR